MTARSAVPSPLRSARARPVGFRSVRNQTWGAERPVAVADQHRDDVRRMAGDREVRQLIAVEVARDKRPWSHADCEHARGLEGPKSVAEQHGHVVVHIVGDGEILLVIAIEIADDEADRTVAHGESLRRSEGPIAVAEQQRHRIRPLGIDPVIGDRQVLQSVVVEVAHDHGVRAAARLEGPRRLEGPVAVAEQHRDGGGHEGGGGVVVGVAVVGNHEIHSAVAIEVAHRDRSGTSAGVEGQRGLKRSVAVAGQDRHGVGSGIGDGLIELAVLIEVGDDDGLGVSAHSVVRRCRERPSRRR